MPWRLEGEPGGSVERLLTDTGNLAAQPGARELPLALDRALGDADEGGRFFHGQATEEPQLHDLSLARVERGETGERVVEDDQIDVLGHGLRQVVQIVHGHERPAAPARLRIAAAGVIDQDAPHRAGGDAEEGGATLETALSAGEP